MPWNKIIAYKCLYEVAQKTDSLSLLNIRNQNEQIFKLTCFDSPPSNSQKYCVWCKKLSSWVSVVQIRRFPLVVRPAVFRTVLRRQKAISTRGTFISKWHNQAAFLPLVGLKKKRKAPPSGAPPTIYKRAWRARGQKFYTMPMSDGQKERAPVCTRRRS